MNSVISQKKYNEILALLNEVGIEVLNKRAEPTFWIQTKPDASLVTNVDYWANDEICSRMKQLFPDDVIIGEESEDKSYPVGAERVWYIDPIDGTKAFVKGEPHFYILIGLAINGVPKLGFCFKPSENLLIYTHENDVRLSINQIEIEIPELKWSSHSSLVQKKLSAEQSTFLKQEFGKSKEPYVYDMVSQLGPIFSKSIGYIGFRRTFYWDLCAPAAIMLALGFKHERFHKNGEKAFLNDGSIKCRTHYTLPNDSPITLLDWFEAQLSILPDGE